MMKKTMAVDGEVNHGGGVNHGCGVSHDDVGGFIHGGVGVIPFHCTSLCLHAASSTNSCIVRCVSTFPLNTQLKHNYRGN